MAPTANSPFARRGQRPSLLRRPPRLGPGRLIMQPRNATVAVVGAGDYIGGAIAERFAAEG